MALFDGKEKIGGPGKFVQIDESKIGKWKYHRGHVVEGQWVFGGIEEVFYWNFIAIVEDRKEETLLNLIKQWIEPGTTIISDCWKGYVNLSRHGYIHKTVNHSVEFVNEEGFHTNKIEGNWGQMKARLPKDGRKKKNIIIQLSYTVRIPIFWLVDLYHVTLSYHATTSLTSLSWYNSRGVNSIHHCHYTMALADLKFDDFCLQCIQFE